MAGRRPSCLGSCMAGGSERSLRLGVTASIRDAGACDGLHVMCTSRGALSDAGTLDAYHRNEGAWAPASWSQARRCPCAAVRNQSRVRPTSQTGRTLCTGVSDDERASCSMRTVQAGAPAGERSGMRRAESPAVTCGDGAPRAERPGVYRDAVRRAGSHVSCQAPPPSVT